MPSTHVVYEGLDKVKNDINEEEETKPVLSYAISKSNNEKIERQCQYAKNIRCF